MNARSRRRLLLDEFALALDASVIARQVAIAADDPVAGNAECDRIGGAGTGDGTDRVWRSDRICAPAISHRGSDRNRAQRFPNAALERRPAQSSANSDPCFQIEKFPIVDRRMKKPSAGISAIADLSPVYATRTIIVSSRRKISPVRQRS